MGVLIVARSRWAALNACPSGVISIPAVWTVSDTLLVGSIGVISISIEWTQRNTPPSGAVPVERERTIASAYTCSDAFVCVLRLACLNTLTQPDTLEIVIGAV